MPVKHRSAADCFLGSETNDECPATYLMAGGNDPVLRSQEQLPFSIVNLFLSGENISFRYFLMYRFNFFKQINNEVNTIIGTKCPYTIIQCL